MATAIEFNNISKQYRLGLVSTKTLSADLNRWWAMNIRGKEDPYLKIGSVNDRSSAADSEYVWALKDIDFKVEQGDVVGIIGKNGAGKSTLLKLLSKITSPTTGTINARGRIGALLEVGTGFHPEMTGRENIYLNGAIMGMSKKEISRKMDEIVDFSGCERYIDTPTKRYSSGMTVRLGFAVAAFMEPEILVVDEVLAVGDIEFQKKAIGKMQDVSQGEGRTVLFVSHNMAAVKRLCKRGIVLKNGMMCYDDSAVNAVDFYIESNYSRSSDMYFDDLSSAPGNENIRIRSFSLRPSVGKDINIMSGIDVDLVFKNHVQNAIVDATFEVCTMDDVIIFHRGTIISPDKNSLDGEYHISFHIPSNMLNAGRYRMKVWFGQNCRYLLWGKLIYDFEVSLAYDSSGFVVGERPGLIRPDFDFKTEFIG